MKYLLFEKGQVEALLGLMLSSFWSEEPFKVKKPKTFPVKGYIFDSYVSDNTSLPEQHLLSDLATFISILRAIHIVWQKIQK